MGAWRWNMLQRKIASPAAWATLLLAMATAVAPGMAQKRPAGTLRHPDKLTMGEDDVKRLIVLIGWDRQDKVSRDEFLKFMEEEFARLDKDKTGQVDVEAIERSMSTIIMEEKGNK
jgi:hypothetical protein